jgi:hypothetical protein
MTAPKLWIINKDSMPIRQIEARPGLKTYAGRISRVSEKSIWTIDRRGNEQLHRECDGRLPSIYQSYAPKE